MLINLIFGVLAGYLARLLHNKIAQFTAKVYSWQEEDNRLISFIIMLLIASFILYLSEQNGMPFLLILGGAIGAFYTELYQIFKESYNKINK